METGKRLLFGGREMDGFWVDGRMKADVQEMATLMGYRADLHRFGMRIRENVIIVQTDWGDYRGIQIGCVPYCSAPAIFEGAGYKVTRGVMVGLPTVFIHSKF